MQSLQSVDEQYASGSVATGGGGGGAVPPSSPFFSSSASGSASGASSNWDASIPSTPAAYVGYNPTIGIGKMSLGSRYNTPRRGVVGLPGDAGDEEGEGEGMVVESERAHEKGGDGEGKVVVVDTMSAGVTVKAERDGVVVVVEAGEEGGERGVGGMDVDG